MGEALIAETQMLLAYSWDSVGNSSMVEVLATQASPSRGSVPTRGRHKRQQGCMQEDIAELKKKLTPLEENLQTPADIAK